MKFHRAPSLRVSRPRLCGCKPSNVLGNELVFEKLCRNQSKNEYELIFQLVEKSAQQTYNDYFDHFRP